MGKQGIKDAVTIGGFFIGGAELVLAKSIAKLTVAVFQLGISSINVMLDQETRDKLNASGHEEIIIALDVISFMSEGVSLSSNHYKNIVHVLNIFNSSKESIEKILDKSKYDEMNSYISSLEQTLNSSE